jgi:hypothetical protein
MRRKSRELDRWVIFSCFDRYCVRDLFGCRHDPLCVRIVLRDDQRMQSAAIVRLERAVLDCREPDKIETESDH